MRTLFLGTLALLLSSCAGTKDRGTRSPEPVEMVRLEDVAEEEADVPAPTITTEAEKVPAPAAPRSPAEEKLVLGLQELLETAGHDPGPIDGRMGPRTERAVAEFQRGAGLEATGMPDLPTLRAMLAPQIEPVAGYETEPAAPARPEPSVRGGPTWMVLLLAAALVIALLLNAAQYSAVRRGRSSISHH